MTGRGIAVDAPARPTSRAIPDSSDFPASLGPGYDTTLQRLAYDAFVVKLDAAGTTRATPPSSAAASDDGGYDIAVDDAGQAHVTGNTGSADFPASLGPGYDTSYNGGLRRLRRQAERGRHRPALRYLPRRQLQ